MLQQSLVTASTRTALQVIPAVDVLEGSAVRLRQGDFSARFLDAGDPLALVRRYAEAGATLIHVVDLDGARSGASDVALIGRIVDAAAPSLVQIAGGIRTVDAALSAISSGAARVVIGTAAVDDERSLEAFVAALGEKLVVAVDVKAGEVLSHGWVRSSGKGMEDVVSMCRNEGVGRILCTAVERDGTAAGPDLELLRKAVAGAAPVPVIASGGVGSHEALAALGLVGVEACVVGRAFLDGSLPVSLVT